MSKEASKRDVLKKDKKHKIKKSYASKIRERERQKTDGKKTVT